MKKISAFAMVSLMVIEAHAQLVNPYIPLMVRPLQLPDPLQQAQQIEQIRALQLQNQQAEMQRRQMEEQARSQRLQNQQQEEARRQQSQTVSQPSDPVIDEWLKAAASRMGLYQDFEKVVFAPDVAITTDMIRLMTPSPLAADIAYYLGSHKMESLAISKMTLVDAARSIDRIEQKLKASKLP